MYSPSGLYDYLYPGILDYKLPASLGYCLKSSLDWDPRRRTSFQAMYAALSNDGCDYGDFEDLNGPLEIQGCDNELLMSIQISCSQRYTTTLNPFK
jgi:hypothetical protein